MNGIRRINLIKTVTLLVCVCETNGYNIGPDTDYCEKFFYFFPPYGAAAQRGPWPPHY